MISLSLASVLVISENSRMRSPNAAPIARPAASRTPRSRSESRLSAALTVRSSPPSGTRIPATVSSNSRDHALRPVTSFSCSSFSSSSESWCGRNTRRSRSHGRQGASSGVPSLASSAASSSRLSSRVKKIRSLLIAVTRSFMLCAKRPIAGSVESPANRSWA